MKTQTAKTPAKAPSARPAAASSKPAPAQAKAVNATSAKATAPKAAPGKATPVKSVPVKAAPAKAAPVKPAPVKASVAQPAPAKANAVKAAPAKAAPAKDLPPKAAPRTPEPAQPVVLAAASVAVPRAGRPSSRLAQITVPSMAQSVASTAAKASFTQIMPATNTVPSAPAAIKKDPKLANHWKTRPLEQLTDADILAMPDAEYMNDVQMAYFRLKLVGLKKDILSNAGETTEHLREDTVVVPDPADRATIEEEHALELRTRDRERKLLKKIEQSIGRIDAGDYGYCDETGEAIGVGRLLARPTATLSLEAQQRRELKQKMFGD